jgi:predicted acylesterase/phospholipase RssA
MTDRPGRAVLSLDGGGVRGAITVAFLERMEALAGSGAPAPLAKRFDLVGGTSTGAVIAGAIALGHRAADIRDFYLELAPRVFRRSPWRIPGVRTAFDSRPLEREIARIAGERTLETADLATHLAVVMKRMDTGSAWVVTSSPNGKWWADGPDHLGNRHYKLKSLIRASTAAPHYFAPQPIPVVPGEPPGLFVDDGMTPHNNPALLLIQVATVPDYGFGWPAGADQLTIVSVGTGSFRTTLAPEAARRMSPAGLAIRALAGMIADGEANVLALCQWLGTSQIPWRVNAEIGDLSTAPKPAAPLFRFIRYDVRLEADWLAGELGLRLSRADVARLRRIDDAGIIPLAHEIGRAAAERFVEPGHLPAPGCAPRPAAP